MALEPLSELKICLEKKSNSLSKNEENSFSQGYKTGVEQSFFSFSKLVKKFEKYQNNVSLLMKEEKTIWKKWVSYYEQSPDISKHDYINKYNDWLFSFLFKENEEQSFTSLY